MNIETQEKIATEIYDNIWDMNLQELRDFHMCFCQNLYFSMQKLTKQDISEDFIEKHFNLSEHMKKIK